MNRDRYRRLDRKRVLHPLAIPARRSLGSPVGSQMNSADSDSNDGHLGPRSDREWRRQYGPQLAQKWCGDCHAVGAEDAEAYGSVPNFVLIAEMCFSIGGLNLYSRRSTVPGLRRGKQELVARL
jgi:hypothetical protein